MNAVLPKYAPAKACVIYQVNGGQSAELGILQWMKDHALEIPFVAATNSREDALELCRAGASLVIQTDDLAGDRIGGLLESCGPTLEELSHWGKSHHESFNEHDKAGTLYIG